MTSTQQKGIPSERVRGPPTVNIESLECSICRDLLWKPIACKACETPFCSICMNQWLVRNPNQCPFQCEAYTERKCPPFIAKILSQLQIACFYQSNGCEEVKSYEALEKHELECGYQHKQCSGCETQMLKKDFPEHKKSCELFQLTCKNCKTMYKRSEATTKHTENICLKKQLKRLHHASKESKLEMEKLRSEIIELRQLNSFLTQKTITFDNLPSALQNVLDIPSIYKGLKWTKFSYMHELYATKRYPQSGYVNSFMPGGSLHVAYCNETSSISVDQLDKTFTLVSLLASAAWNDDLQLIIIGYRKSTEVHYRNVTLLFGRPQLINLQWKNIDTITLKPSGGTAHSGSGQGAGSQVILTQLIVDNLSE